ncbi:hypothetical protein SAMN05216275_116114 [Streptosporangium canum]|uniref:Secreted protein n=1 Tax=Streptosporangium canum TaxID=324952 RepID=A0A1I3WIG9_9ACTN|nr:hypothetical protein [Streptosporangium canum]SFK06246.1 hypothetical protein SAMN05216275_116114 [Streptosporangium canum]
MRPRTRDTLAVLLLALTLPLAGCGSGDDGGGTVASAGGAKTGDGTGAAKSVSPGEMGVKFAQCMRENGVDMEDPKPGEGMRLTLKKGKESEKAMEACREYSPMENGPKQADPEAEEKGRKFAACMRENGVEEFADPPAGQRGIRINEKIAEDPDFPKAQKQCEGIFRGGPGSPDGPGGGADQ